MAKYAPLNRHLTGVVGDSTTMTFDEIAALVAGLPRSAFAYQAWWANSRSHPNAVAWLDAGWEVKSFDLQRQRVTFRRVAGGSRFEQYWVSPPEWFEFLPPTKPEEAHPREVEASSVRQRVELLTAEFPALLSYYDSVLPFDRSGQYANHRRTIDLRFRAGSVEAATADETFVASLYETLQSWGIGKRASRLASFPEFEGELRRWSKSLVEFNSLHIDDPGLDTDRVGLQLWRLIDGMKIVENKARLVALSKTIHHLLPDLLPPIDRMYTQEFFGFHPADFQDRQRQTFLRLWEQFVTIARAVEPVRHVGAGWRTSRTKVIDNAIVALIHRQRVQSEARPWSPYAPKRFRRCPRCRSTAAVRKVIYGMPALPPTADDEASVVFAGCVVPDGIPPDWWCGSCRVGFTGGEVVEEGAEASGS